MLKNKIKTAVCSVVTAALILSVTILTSNETKGIETAGVLTILVDNATMTSGTSAYATNSTGGYYNGSVTLPNRIGFGGMPSGSYHIVICANTTTGAKNYVANGFSYGGGDQAVHINLVNGPCNPD